MSQKQIRVGLVGAGYIAQWHADAVRATEGVEVTAVCDVSKEAAQNLAEGLNARAFTSLDELIDAGVCDAVHILTPPQLHHDLAVSSLDGGLHVMVEKPFALNSEQCVRMNEAANSAGRILGVGHNFLGVPSYSRLKNLIAEGALGQIATAEVNWHFPLAPLRSGPFGLWMLRSPENLLLELGPHLYAFAIDLFDELQIDHVALSKPVEVPGVGTRYQSWRVLATAGDVDVTFTLSLGETSDDRSLALHGSSGNARLDYAADTLIVERENASDIVLNQFGRQTSLVGQHLREGVVNATRQMTSLNRKSPYALSFHGAVSSFYQAVRFGEAIDPRFSGESAQQVIEAIEHTIPLMPPYAREQRHVLAPVRNPQPSVAVIGGTGFIGAHLTRALVASGRDVRVLSRGKTTMFDAYGDAVEVVSVSLKDKEGLKRAFDGVEAVYHLARALEPTWEACLENDVKPSELIAEAALEANVSRFIYTGTIASYDMSRPDRAITEQTGFAADMSDRNLYARSKALCEERLLEMHKQKGLPLIIARPGIVVGPGGPLQHWGIGRWHGAGAVRIWGSGHNILPFVLIDDVSDALIKMLEVKEVIGQSFNLVGEPMFTARDYFDAIHERLGAKIHVRSSSLSGFYWADGIKAALKKYALRKHGVIRASLRDWKSRAHLSPFENDLPKRILNWRPESEKDRFIERAIVEANLFGYGSPRR